MAVDSRRAFVNLVRVFRFASRSLKYPVTRSKIPFSRTETLKTYLKLPLTVLLPVMAAAGVTSPELQKIIDECEELYEKKDFLTMYDLLIPHKESNDANILWRLARAATEKGKLVDKEEKKSLTYEAWDYITKALELDDKNFACHKWYGILLDKTAEYEGTQKRISNAFKVKEHFMKALELNPKDATTMYCLGYWCFLFADMPWYQRKIASVIFATPPTSTYEEALGYFKQAEETDPGFYNMNNKMLGLTYLRLKDKELAKTYFLKAINYPAKSEDDKQAVKEAADHLKSL
ncbi:regulator of microtubule dynamics protein 1-like [Plakobranchus ocellatus]|uniref:Regulator of microtubule dynamics protein 1 n=1 Tax=Plakobranchus ocellatus TaxID=259542 RepID=A0AAV4BMT0_9GAST|nr:regulator of microtubule dynamics protein 1-like [Plakobranchus ocellatus]